MASKEYVAIFIKPKTRKHLKVMGAKEGLTFDQIINKLMGKA